MTAIAQQEARDAECERRIEELLKSFNPGEDALAEIEHEPPCVRLRALEIAQGVMTAQVLKKENRTTN